MKTTEKQQKKEYMYYHAYPKYEALAQTLYTYSFNIDEEKNDSLLKKMNEEMVIALTYFIEASYTRNFYEKYSLLQQSFFTLSKMESYSIIQKQLYDDIELPQIRERIEDVKDELLKMLSVIQKLETTHSLARRVSNKK